MTGYEKLGPIIVALDGRARQIESANEGEVPDDMLEEWRELVTAILALNALAKRHAPED